MKVNTLRLPRLTFLAIVLMTVMGGVIRCVIADGDLLWLDELHTSWVVRGRFSEVALRAADGNQTPLYFWLTWVPVRLLGESEIAVRAVSLLAGIGLIFAVPWVCWNWTRSSIATVVVAFLVAFNLDPFIYYSTEARPYGVLQLLSLVQVAFFMAAVSTGAPENAKCPARRRPYWGFAILSAGLVYIHFTSVWIFVAEFLFLAVVGMVMRCRRPIPRGGMISIALTILLTMVICFPAIIQMMDVIGRKGNWTQISSVTRFWSAQQVSLIVGIAIPAVGLFVLMMIEKRWLRCAATHPFDFFRGGFVLLWAVIPMACILTLTWLEMAPIALSRYAQVGAVAIPLLGGMAIGQLSTRRCQAALAMVILVASLVGAPGMMYPLSRGEVPVLRFENWKTPAEVVRTNVIKRDQPILLFGNLIEDVDAFTNHDSRFQDYLEFPVRGMYPFTPLEREIIVYPTMAFTEFRTDDLQEIREQNGAWIVVRAQRGFVDELIYQLDRQSSSMAGRPGESLQVTVLGSPDSDVYLLSVDYRISGPPRLPGTSKEP